jgi:hypothetical protein
MKSDARLTDHEVAQSRSRWLEAVKLQEVEGNSLTPDEIAMFEMFERERWSHERCIDYILAQAQRLAAE